MIEVSHLTKEYGKVKALRDVNMSVESGQMVAILGPNGAGKSTFLNILSTALRPSQGCITYDGMTIDKNAMEIRQKIGVVFQDTILDKELTTLQNLEIHAGLYGLGKDAGKAAVSALENVGLTEKAGFKVGFLSGGMKRKLELAKCLINDPDIIILDEPTTGLDVQTRKDIWESIRKLNKEKKVTVFLATHYIEEASICDKIFIIDKGQIIEEGDVATLLKKYSKTRILLSVDEESEKKLKAFDFTRVGDYLEIDSEQPAPIVLGELFQQNIKINDIIIEPSSLEDAYLKITGGSLREEQYTEVRE